MGDVTEIRGAIGTPYNQGSFRTDFRKERGLSGGGVLFDLGIHLIDLSVWLLGASPTDVAYDCNYAPGWKVETDACVCLEFPCSTRATIACSFIRALENAVTVRGTGGWARASLYDPTKLELFSVPARICQKDGAQQIILPARSMYDRQVEHFCESVLSGSEFLVRPREVKAGISVVEWCYSCRAECA